MYKHLNGFFILNVVAVVIAAAIVVVVLTTIAKHYFTIDQRTNVRRYKIARANSKNFYKMVWISKLTLKIPKNKRF